MCTCTGCMAPENHGYAKNVPATFAFNPSYDDRYDTATNKSCTLARFRACTDRKCKICYNKSKIRFEINSLVLGRRHRRLPS